MSDEDHGGFLRPSGVRDFTDRIIRYSDEVSQAIKDGKHYETDETTRKLCMTISSLASWCGMTGTLKIGEGYGRVDMWVR